MLNKTITDFLNSLEKDMYSYSLKSLHDWNDGDDDTFDNEITLSNWNGEKYRLTLGERNGITYLFSISPLTLIERRKDEIIEKYRTLEIDSIQHISIKDNRIFVIEEIYKDNDDFDNNTIEENEYFLSEIFKKTNGCESLEEHLNESNIEFDTHLIVL